MHRTLLVVALTLSMSVGSAAGTPYGVQPPKKRTGKQVLRPHHERTVVRKFTPPAKPSPAYVRSVIIPHESGLWGASQPTVMRRIGCESNYHWWATNGQYAGLGQFGPNAWGRARGMPKKVTRTVNKTELARRVVILRYSDGSHKRVRGKPVRRRLVVKYKGLLPAWPSPYHGWAAVRGVARAAAGVGGVRASEWSCR